jgi:hypothetical protein
MTDMLSLRYMGDGAFRPGLPMRDIDQAELAHFDPAKIAAAVAAGLYAPLFAEADTESHKPTKAELREQAAARGLDLPAKATNAQLSEAIDAFDAAAAAEPEVEA